jgi:hypothetical protein
MDLLDDSFMPKKKAALVICGVWSLWSGRNARKHGKERWNPGVAVRHIAKMLEDLVCSTPSREVLRPMQQTKWSKPPEDWLKVNTDAPLKMQSAIGASGAVLRNSRGVR